MKKSLLIGTFTAFLLMSGCSDKSQTESDMATSSQQSSQSADSQLNSVASVGGSSGSDNMSAVDSKMAQIKDLEAKLQAVYFDFDKYNVRDDQKGAVAQNASVLKSATGFTYKIEGNCDEWGTDEYNYALGLKRARSVRDGLVAEGINKANMIMVSYGESKPACMEKNKSCWSKNRRVEVKVLP